VPIGDSGRQFEEATMSQSLDGMRGVEVEFKTIDVTGTISKERLVAMKRRGFRLVDETSLGDGRTRYRFKRGELEET
jgi:hypothetical protein